MSDTKNTGRDNTLTLADQHQALIEVHDLLVEYCVRVDRLSDLAVADLYTEDGIMILGQLRADGRDEISIFFQDRNATEIDAGRSTRHIVSNTRLLEVTDSEVEVGSTVCVYAGFGSLPLESASPATIADMRDICTQQEDGSWLFRRRHASVVFVNSELASPFIKTN